MTISEVTRRNLFDELSLSRHHWSGRLSETDFLARIYDLSSLPSTDTRFRTARRDIWQHREYNDDWPNDWVFSDSRFDLAAGDDEVLLRFLCEMLHPIVRHDSGDVSDLLAIMDKHLQRDGWEIVKVSEISGLPIYAGRQLVEGMAPLIQDAERVADRLGPDYMSRQINRLQGSIEKDPELAIGTAKEFVESVCVSILEKKGVKPIKKRDFPKLVRETCKALKLAPDDIPESAKAAETIRVLLSNLGAVASGLAELRNPYGTGHGKGGSYSGLAPRHARLATSAAITLATFLYETNLAR